MYSVFEQRRAQPFFELSEAREARAQLEFLHPDEEFYILDVKHQRVRPDLYLSLSVADLRAPFIYVVQRAQDESFLVQHGG